jgi:hypothetical protein
MENRWKIDGKRVSSSLRLTDRETLGADRQPRRVDRSPLTVIKNELVGGVTNNEMDAKFAGFALALAVVIISIVAISFLALTSGTLTPIAP